ncbi:MAG TPA: hypothetical protein VN667_10950 [Burkholderiales bacterium]|nr:hypothetical protein [Burkholderiales bacterium]
MASACAYSAGAYHSPESSVASGTAWSSSGGGTITFDTATNHGLLPNDTVTVAGVSPSGYNGVYVVASIPGGKIFTVAKSTNPGTWSSGGTVTGPATNSLASGTSWSGGTVTFTTALAHNFAEGNTVVITGASPSGYNGTFTVTGVPSSTTFTATLASDPGTWVSGGVFASNDCYTGTSTTWLMDGTSSFHTVRVEVEPRAPACGSTAPLLKFWLLPSSVCSPAFSLASGTSWSDASGSGTITFKTSAAHGYTVGDSVTVAGASPTGYNGTYTVLSVPDTLTFTVANATDPGTWTSGGKPVSTECSAMTGMTAQYQPTHFPATGVHLAQCVPTPSPANAFDSVYFGFTSNNATLGNTQDNVILQNLSSGVIGLP